MDITRDLNGLMKQLRSGDTRQAQIYLDRLITDSQRAVYGISRLSKGSDGENTYPLGQASRQTIIRLAQLRPVLLDISNPLVEKDSHALDLACLALEIWKGSEQKSDITDAFVLPDSPEKYPF